MALTVANPNGWKNWNTVPIFAKLTTNEVGLSQRAVTTYITLPTGITLVIFVSVFINTFLNSEVQSVALFMFKRI